MTTVFRTQNWRDLYVERQVLNRQDIVDWAMRAGFSKTFRPQTFHVTLAYSKSKVPWYLMEADSVQGLYLPAEQRQIEFFGGYVVLRLNSYHLQDRFDQFIKWGCSYDYPEYKPHISIIGSKKYVDLTKLYPYSGPIHLGPERWAPLKEDWNGED